MAIVITDMTVCDGGNHVTLFVSEDGGEARPIAVDFDKLHPDMPIADIATFMGELSYDKPEDVEPLYRVINETRRANAREFDVMRVAVLAALGEE